MERGRMREVLSLAGAVCFLAVCSWAQKTEAALPQGSLQRYSEIFDTQEELPEAEAVIEENGISYRLMEQEVVAVPVTGRVKKLSGETEYREVGKTDPIPETAVMTVKDEESGKELEAELGLWQTGYGNERWLSGFSFIATFHTYGADFYTYGDVRVSHQADKPELSSCTEAFMQELGLDPEEYRLEDSVWQGDAYRDDAGVLCRDARITGKRKVWDCQAVYGGMVKLPDFSRYRLRMVYGRAGEETEQAAETEQAETEISQDDREEAAVSGQKEPGLWEKLMRILRKRAIRISIGIFFAAAAVWLLRLLFKAAGRVGEEEDR